MTISRQLWVGLALLSGVATGCGGAAEGVAAARGAVREGLFERRVDLTGDVRAARGDVLNVPLTPAGQLPIRWLIEDGAGVEAGARVVELDNAEVAGDLEQKRAAVTEASAALRLARSEAEGKLAQAELERAKAGDELTKARLLAEVPAEILAAREHGERQLALARAEAEVGKAEAALARSRAEVRETVGAAELAAEARRRELAVTEEALAALVVRAPKAGLALVQDHGWERRRLRTGDTVYPGMPLIVIPELDSLEVEASLFDVDDGAVRVGDPARCLADAYPGEVFACRVTAIAAMARELSPVSARRVFRVHLAFDDPARARERLRPGMSVRAEVMAERREHARLVARVAVDWSGDQPRLPGATAVVLGPCNAIDCVLEDATSAALASATPGRTAP
jgi:HlyD family secretion protein